MDTRRAALRLGVPAFLLVALPWIALPTDASAATELYVAPDGKDDNRGTRAKPVATLERARDLIRELKRQGQPPTGGVTVWLRGGVYERSATFELSQQDSGTEPSPIIYRACPDEDVRIVGGRMIPPSAVRPVTDQAVLSRIISREARSKVRQIDLRGLGITDYGAIHARGFRRPYVPAHLELFIDDEAMHLARWPNEGTVPIGKVIDPGSVPRDGDYANRGGTFTYADDRPKLWRQAKDVWLSGLFAYGYADDTIRVASIDTDKKIITMAQAHMYGIKSGRPWHGYYALNLLEEIDSSGEYVVDGDRGILYFLPPAPVGRSTRIAVSILETPMVAMEGVSFVRFRDLTFEVTRGMGVYIERGTGNRIAGCTLRNIGIVAVCIGMGIEPDTIYRHEMTGKRISRQLGSWHEHIYENSVLDRQGGTNHGVVACDIYNIGAGGISLGGGDRRTLTPAGNFVDNCHIHHFNRLGRSYKAGVNIDGDGNRITHCLIHHCPNNAIYLHGNDHLIEFNEVHHACENADDMGVFYMGRDPSEQGNVIRYNLWHHNGNDHGNTCTLYFDDDACGVTVFGNVFYASKGSAIWINHGCDHVICNNLFVAMRGTLSAGTDTRAYDWKTDTLQQKRLKVDLDVTAPPYAERYPRLLQTYNTPKGAGRGSDVHRNVSIRSGAFGKGTNDLKDNVVTEEDPGFVNLAEMDLRLRDDSSITKQIPGFQRIPLEKMGLSVDEYRKALPVTPPVFEVGARRFVDQTVVRLRCPSPGAVIVYTLDGNPPTPNSPRYQGPITLTRSTTISAMSLRPESPRISSAAVTERFEQIQARPATHCKVNFQTASAPRPAGYLIDTGAAFAVADSGFAYGWSQDNTEAARKRGKHPDDVLDSLVHFTAGVVWEIAVENGTYDVTVTIGDSEYRSTDETLWVEDVEFCKGHPLAVNEFLTVTKSVKVTDGLLTLRSNDSPHGPGLTRLNAVVIAKRP